MVSRSQINPLEISFDESKKYLTAVYPEMTPQEMREYYLYQTLKSLESWEREKGYSIRENQPFKLDDPGPVTYFLSPDQAKKINLRKQIDEFAKESQVSTAGVRENQNVLCPWDHRYRINEYIFAVIAESLSRMVKELHQQRLDSLPAVSADQVRRHLGEDNVKIIEEIYGMSLDEAVAFARQSPIRIVGGEVRANTPRFIDLVSRIYAANGLHVFLMKNPENKDTSSIFMWSFLIFILGLSGGNYFTSSHGAPQKQSDKILSFDGAQYLPPQYARLVEHMRAVLDTVEAEGFTFRLAARDDVHLRHRLTYENTARLYTNYLKCGPASSQAVELINNACQKGLRLKLDFFGGSGYKMISSIFNELGISRVFENGYIRTEEDPFFHNIGFKLAPRKHNPDELEVVHLSVDASLKAVVETAGYTEILKDAPAGQVVYNVDPDVDRFVAGQVVPVSEKSALDELGISSIALGHDRLFALYSPNQLFLMIADNDMIQAKHDGWWSEYSNFDIHTYVSALSWDEWASCNGIPVIRVPVGFKEIAAIERAVEGAMKRHPDSEIAVNNELGDETKLGLHPKLHHAGEESGGKIGGPRVPIYNIYGEFVIAMREKSSGEAAFSAVALQSRLHCEAESRGTKECVYLHNYLREIFARNSIKNPMEFRGDIIHYNEAIIDPDELAKAKKEGIGQRNVFNTFFRYIAMAYKTGERSKLGRPLTIDEVRELFIESMPTMKKEWSLLERIDLWSDGLQLWFSEPSLVRDICLRASGTDAKSKVYFDGKDKVYLQKLYKENFELFVPKYSSRYKELIVTE
ncbi:MAG: hypothetical protein AB2L14_09475 [Candidatus Xenobiia bacterium LiM19]